MKLAKKILEDYALNKIYKKDLEKEYKLKENHKEDLLIVSTELNKMTKVIENVEQTISSLNQPSKNILFYRYIKNNSYDMIALKLNYSQQRVYQLLKKALEEFENNYKQITA